MLSCNCSTQKNSRKEKHSWNCEFLANRISNFCCDKGMETSKSENVEHEESCYNFRGATKIRKLWIATINIEGPHDI